MTRAAKAGKRLGKSIIEMVHLMYQNNTALTFLKALYDTLFEELDKRQKETATSGNHR